MKKLITCTVIFCAILSTTFAQNGALDRVFNQYAGKDGFTTIEISSNLFNLFMSEEDKLDEIKIGNIKVLAVEDDRSNKSLNFYDEIIPQLNTSQYEKLVQVNSEEEDVLILHSKEESDHSEFLVVAGGDDNALIYIEGSLDFAEAEKAVKSLRKQLP